MKKGIYSLLFTLHSMKTIKSNHDSTRFELCHILSLYALGELKSATSLFNHSDLLQQIGFISLCSSNPFL